MIYLPFQPEIFNTALTLFCTAWVPPKFNKHLAYEADIVQKRSFNLQEWKVGKFSSRKNSAEKFYERPTAERRK